MRKKKDDIDVFPTDGRHENISVSKSNYWCRTVENRGYSYDDLLIRDIGCFHVCTKCSDLVQESLKSDKCPDKVQESTKCTKYSDKVLRKCKIYW